MKLSMLHKMLLRILLPVLLGLGVMSFLDYRSARQVMEAQIQTDLETIVDTQVNELRSVQRTLTGGLRSLSHLTSFQQLIQAAEAGASKEELASLSEKASNLAASLVKDYAMIYSAALIDAKGTVLAHSAHKNIGSSYADREYFKKAMQGDDIQVQNVVSRASGIQATILAASFKNAEGKRVGMVMMTMDNAGLASMTTNQLKIGSRGFCYAYNMKGEMALHPDKSLIGRDDSSLPHVRRMLETGQGVTSYMNGEEERLLYYQALPSMHWIIIMDVSRDELFEPLATMLARQRRHRAGRLHSAGRRRRLLQRAERGGRHSHELADCQEYRGRQPPVQRGGKGRRGRRQGPQRRAERACRSLPDDAGQY